MIRSLLQRAVVGASLVILPFAGSPAGAQQAPAAIAVHPGAQAPADEYFGRLKLSILGVRNVVNDVDRRIDAVAGLSAAALCHRLVVAEDALRDWQVKYPDDSWIPQLGTAMVKEYERLDAAAVDEEFRVAGVHAVDLANFLEAHYPQHSFAPPK